MNRRLKRATAHHALDIVEASYRLDGTDAQWLARVLEVASTNFELGRGCYGFTCSIEGTAFSMGAVYVERQLDPRWGGLVEQINREIPNAVVDVLARTACLCGGFSEVLGNHHPGTQHFRTVGNVAGITDAFTLFAQDGEGHGLNISAPTEGTMVTAPRVRAIWRRVGLHLAAGLRLRRRLREERAAVDALVDPGGGIAHVEGHLREDGAARDALVESVRRMERARTKAERHDPERALELWRGLVAGEWSLVERWESDGRRYIAAHRNRPDVRDPRALTPYESTVLRYVALGAANKDIAFALGLSVGSVGTAVSQLLRKFGCRRRTDLFAFGEPNRGTRLSVPLAGGDEIAVLSTPERRNEAPLSRLTKAEREVSAQIIEGADTAAIAQSRRTSPHTVSNQIRRMFDKLGVQSRAELVRVLTR